MHVLVGGHGLDGHDMVDGFQLEPTAAISNQLFSQYYCDGEYEPRHAAWHSAHRRADDDTDENVGDRYQHHPRKDDGGDGVKQHHCPRCRDARGSRHESRAGFVTSRNNCLALIEGCNIQERASLRGCGALLLSRCSPWSRWRLASREASPPSADRSW
jgi:hypothetical protein